MKRFKVFPPIGIGRVGGSDSFFLGPETETSMGIEIDDNGHENEIVNFKDSNGLIKRQAARFQIFELDDTTGTYKPIVGNKPSVQWRVQLANKKASVLRPNGRPPKEVPSLPLQMIPNTENLSIVSEIAELLSSDNTNRDLTGKYKDRDVYLGTIKNDPDGNLIVIGGKGVSNGPYNSNMDFYFNKDWYDDISDGFIQAYVKLNDGSEIEADGAWIIISPPDFAPNIKSVVTLYDIMQNMEVENGRIVLNRFEFFQDILPMIERFKAHKWVENGDFDINYNIDQLVNNSYENFSVRSEVFQKVLTIQNLQKFKLTDLQLEILNSYMYGDYEINDSFNYSEEKKLTKAVLSSTVGQAFYPGIELGIISENFSMYSEPYRIDQDKVSPGDLTALMALPWQADFLKCSNGWWPSQRPNKIYDYQGVEKEWTRGIGRTEHQKLIDNFNKLGFIKPKNEVQFEEERDGGFPDS